MKVLTVDFDGTLAHTNYPTIVKQKFIHKLVARYIEHKRKQGWIITLTTLRENKPWKKDNYLEQALNWCKEKGIEFDFVNENPPAMTEHWGHSRKFASSLNIDDMNAGLLGWILRRCDR